METLKSPTASPGERMRLAQALADTPHVESKRKEVCRVLQPMVVDVFCRNAAIQALCAWGNADDLVALAKGARGLDFVLRAKLISKLAAGKDARSAEVLVQVAVNAFDKMAVQALKNMGHVAEDAVIGGMLNHTDSRVRFEACGILGVVGGEKSFAALNRLLRIERAFQTREATMSAPRQLRSRWAWRSA